MTTFYAFAGFLSGDALGEAFFTIAFFALGVGSFEAGAFLPPLTAFFTSISSLYFFHTSAAYSSSNEEEDISASSSSSDSFFFPRFLVKGVLDRRISKPALLFGRGIFLWKERFLGRLFLRGLNFPENHINFAIS